MRRVGLRGVALAAAAAAGVGLFFTCFEYRTVELPAGPSREAERNPYLAAGRLLERMGHPVRFLAGPAELEELPPPGATLLLPIPRRTLSDERSRALLDWTRAGGHLIVVTYSVWDDPAREPDPLLDPLGLQQYAVPAEAGEGAAEGDGEAAPPGEPGDGAAPGGNEANPLESEPDESFWDVAEAAWPGGGPVLRARFHPGFRWETAGAEPVWQLRGELGIHLVTLRLGEGWITALTDELLLRNPTLGLLDHAQLLVRLARLGGAEGERPPVWIVTAERWPGLWSQAAHHAVPLLASAAVLLAAALWRISRRFGPVLPEVSAATRRSWLEHLEAAGHYDWREARGRTLLAGVRRGVQAALERRRPGIAGLAPGERAARLAELTGLAPEDVERALDPEHQPGSEAGFVAAISHLERIRAEL